VISERIGHADVGFFFQTYAHLLKNDDRDAAATQLSRPRPSSSGTAGIPNQMMSMAKLHKSVHEAKKRPPGGVSEGHLRW
jgi:hypothetical protein